MIEEIIISGVLQGGLYAFLALGFTLIYGISGIINLAHGSFYMLGAYMFYVVGEYIFGTQTILSSFLSLIFAVVIVGLLGTIVYKTVIDPILGDEIGIMVVTIGLAMIFQQLVLLIFGAFFYPVHWPRNSILMQSFTFLGIRIQYSRVFAFAISILLFGSVWLFISKTKIGKAMRAVSQDREAAMLMGVNIKRLNMLTMAISCVAAAAAGILITASTTMHAGAWIWIHPLATSFSIVILGGLGSIKGSLFGGFILGFAEQSVAIAVPQGGAIIGVVPLLVMLIVLIIRPRGLFGKRVEMEE